MIVAFAFSLVLLSQQTRAQAFPPPDHGESTDQSGSSNGAPVGTGVVILLGLGAAYGGKKYHEMNKTTRDE